MFTIRSFTVFHIEPYGSQFTFHLECQRTVLGGSFDTVFVENDQFQRCVAVLVSQIWVGLPVDKEVLYDSCVAFTSSNVQCSLSLFGVSAIDITSLL